MHWPIKWASISLWSSYDDFWWVCLSNSVLGYELNPLDPQAPVAEVFLECPACDIVSGNTIAPKFGD